MKQVTVDIVVNQVLTRCAVWQTDGPTDPLWRAAPMELRPDGTFELSSSVGFAQSSTPTGALAMLLKTPTLTLCAEETTGLTSLATVSAPVAEPIAPPATPVIGATPAPPVPTPIFREDRAAGMSKAIDEAIERFSAQLAAGHTEEFRRYLAFAARFHRYSVGNQLLIRLQAPDATRVAGMSRWNELGYRIRKGEQALWIWAPILKRQPDEETGELVEELVGFRPAPVFDAGQLANLDEKPLPEPFRPLPDDMEHLYQNIKGRVERHGIAVEEQPLPAGVQGTSQGGRITIHPGLDSRRRVLVLLHELAHEIGHHGREKAETTRQQRELEAESVAFVVGCIIGVESPHAADYVLHWQGTPEQLKTSLGTVQRLVKQALAIVEGAGAGSDALAA